jgi:hypothetical protein
MCRWAHYFWVIFCRRIPVLIPAVCGVGMNRCVETPSVFDYCQTASEQSSCSSGVRRHVDVQWWAETASNILHRQRFTWTNVADIRSAHEPLPVCWRWGVVESLQESANRSAHLAQTGCEPELRLEPSSPKPDACLKAAQRHHI